jgi:hypothetical protein
LETKGATGDLAGCATGHATLRHEVDRLFTALDTLKE